MSMLFGYTKKEDGLYYKTVHFGPKGTCAETLVRNAGGSLVRVIRQQASIAQLERRQQVEEQKQAQAKPIPAVKPDRSHSLAVATAIRPSR